jgi:MFS family permease
MHVNIWCLILAMVAEEILEIFSTLAERRYLNRVIERDKIVSRQASVEVRTHAAVLAGRPVGPFLFSIEPFLPFLADAVSFIASVVSLVLLRRVDEPQGEARRLVPRQVIGDISQGFRWLRHDRRASVAVLLMAITSMVAQALILMFLVEAHSKQLSTVAIGLVLAASGAGGAVGSFCSRIVPAAMRSFWLPIQMVAWSVALAFLALAGGQSAYLSTFAMFILGLTGAIGNVEFGTYLVRHVADDMIAKITGIGQMLAIGACALGPVLGGYAIQQFRFQGTIWILLGIVMSLAFVSLLMPEQPQWRKVSIQSIRRAFRARHARSANLGAGIRGGNPHRTVGPESRWRVEVHCDRERFCPHGDCRPQSILHREVLTCRNADLLLLSALVRYDWSWHAGIGKSPEGSGRNGMLRANGLRLICEGPLGGLRGT